MVWCGQRLGSPVDSGDETGSGVVCVRSSGSARAAAPVAVAGHCLALAPAGVMAVVAFSGVGVV